MENNPPVQTSKKVLGWFFEVFKTIAVVAVLAFLLRTFVIQPFQVDGNSMEPNFHNGQYILVNKAKYHFKPPQHEEVIVFYAPRNTKYFFIKRIIGTPGDTVKIESGQVYVNDQPVNESYLPAGLKTYGSDSDEQPYIVKLGTNDYFVLGDNRDESSDSREWGILKRKNIVGKYWVSLSPVSIFSKNKSN